MRVQFQSPAPSQSRTRQRTEAPIAASVAPPHHNSQSVHFEDEDSAAAVDTSAVDAAIDVEDWPDVGTAVGNASQSLSAPDVEDGADRPGASSASSRRRHSSARSVASTTTNSSWSIGLSAGGSLGGSLGRRHGHSRNRSVSSNVSSSFGELSGREHTRWHFRKTYMSFDVVSRGDGRQFGERHAENLLQPSNPDIMEQLLSPDMDDALAERYATRKLTIALGPFHVEDHLLISAMESTSVSLAGSSEAASISASMRSLSATRGGGVIGGGASTAASIMTMSATGTSAGSSSMSTMHLRNDEPMLEFGALSLSDDSECLVRRGRFQLYSADAHELQLANTTRPDSASSDSSDVDSADEDITDERMIRNHIDVARGKGGIFTRCHYRSKRWLDMLRTDIDQADLFVLSWLRSEQEGSSIRRSPYTEHLTDLSFSMHFDPERESFSYRQVTANASNVPTLSPQWATLLEAVSAQKAVIVFYEMEEGNQEESPMRNNDGNLSALRHLAQQRRILLCTEFSQFAEHLSTKVSSSDEGSDDAMAVDAPVNDHLPALAALSLYLPPFLEAFDLYHPVDILKVRISH